MMFLKRALAGLAAVLAFAVPVTAATFTPTFDTPSFTGTQFDVESDPAYNTFYAANFGIEVKNSYLYVDARDTLDGVGIANGWVADNFAPNISGRINFLDTTDFAEVDYVSIRSGGSYSAFAAGGALIDSFSTGAGVSQGTYRFEGGIISYITFTGIGGEVGVSGLTYNYDGTTDGVNTDIGNSTVVPLPASGVLLIAGLGGIVAMRRRKPNS
jgi:hypothetical protein